MAIDQRAVFIAANLIEMRAGFDEGAGGFHVAFARGVKQRGHAAHEFGADAAGSARGDIAGDCAWAWRSAPRRL